MSNSSKRVSKAEVELNKAYKRLLKNADTTKLIIEALADGVKIDEILTKFKSSEKWTEAMKDKWGKRLGYINAALNAPKNKLSGYDGLTVLSELGIDVGSVFTENFVEKNIIPKLGLKYAPLIGWFSAGMDIGNLINQATGFEEASLSQLIKKKLEELRGTTSDLPDLEMLKKGILKITMHDGTVYERPLVDIAGSYMLTGNSKDDVLFGGKGNDMLIGHSGSDILIGGSGKDDYFVDNGDIIKDSDGKGRVFLGSSHQLKGGTQIEKGSKIYKGKDGTKYEIDGYNLIINDNITIENFSKISNDLGIVLVDTDDIVVTIENNQSTEGGNGKHSMEFKITLNRALKKDEFLELIINGQRIKFKEGDIEQTYTHTWDGNTIKEEDRKFEVSGIVMQTSENLNVQAVISGQGLIKDDDQDNDPDPELEASPIVIDFGNDGINSHALNYTINFDLDNNGFKEATGWVSGDDALLAIDKNNNGIIDNGSELFGNKSISDNVFSYTNSSLNNGFETLKSYDSNNDGIIDSQDAEFDKLLLWQDKNGNAITDNGELIKLSDKVSSIDLNYTNTDINNNSNTIRQTSTATLNNGTKVKADDIWFKVNYKDTEEIIDENQIPFEIKALPNVVATGNLHSLHSAMAKNETLATMVNLYLLMDSENSKEFANLNLLVA